MLKVDELLLGKCTAHQCTNLQRDNSCMIYISMEIIEVSIERVSAGITSLTVWGSILDIDWRWAVPPVSRVPSEISPAKYLKRFLRHGQSTKHLVLQCCSLKTCLLALHRCQSKRMQQLWQMCSKLRNIRHMSALTSASVGMQAMGYCMFAYPAILQLTVGEGWRSEWHHLPEGCFSHRHGGVATRQLLRRSTLAKFNLVNWLSTRTS